MYLALGEYATDVSSPVETLTFGSSSSASPIAAAPLVMRDRDYLDVAATVQAVDQGVRVLIREDVPPAAMAVKGPAVRRFDDGFDRAIQRQQKPVCCQRTSLSKPTLGFLCVSDRLGMPVRLTRRHGISAA